MRPTRMISSAVVLAVFVVIAAAAAAAPAVRAVEAAAVSLTIAFTGDVSGYLEPCG